MLCPLSVDHALAVFLDKFAALPLVSILINPDTHSHLKPDTQWHLKSDTCWHHKPDSDLISGHPQVANDAQICPPRRIVGMCDIFISASWYPVALDRDRPVAAVQHFALPISGVDCSQKLLWGM